MLMTLKWANLAHAWRFLGRIIVKLLERPALIGYHRNIIITLPQAISMFRVLRSVSPLDIPSDGWLPARNKVSPCPGLNLDHNVLFPRDSLRGNMFVCQSLGHIML